MNQRSEKELLRIAELFKEIGSELPPPLPLREAKALSGEHREHVHSEHSPICGKNVYATESDARKTMRRRQSKGKQRLRCYWCVQCSGWHITSNA